MQSITADRPAAFSAAEQGKKEAAKALWLSCFDDSEEGVELSLSFLFENAVCYIAEVQGTLCAMLFLIPASLNGERAHYLYAACTRPDFRGRGIMADLIDFSLSDAAKKGDKFSLLLPASKSLYGFYKRFGYESSPIIRRAELSRKEALALASTDFKAAKGKLSISEIRSMAFSGNQAVKFSEAYIKHAVAFNALYGGGFVRCNSGYAIFYESDGVCRVSELACCESGAAEVLTELLKATDSGGFEFRLAPVNPLAPNAEAQDFGMIKRLADSEIPKDIYIGLTLD